VRLWLVHVLCGRGFPLGLFIVYRAVMLLGSQLTAYSRRTERTHTARATDWGSLFFVSVAAKELTARETACSCGTPRKQKRQLEAGATCAKPWLTTGEPRARAGALFCEWTRHGS